MEIRKFWMIPLFLLFILMLGCVSASGDFDDVVSYNQSDDQLIQLNDFNEDLIDESGAVSSDKDDAGAGTNDNVLSSENLDDVGAREGDDVLGATLSYAHLHNSIYDNGNEPVELTLQNDYAYDKNNDASMEYGGIIISKSVTIHGNGHKIDGMGIFAHFVLTQTTSGSSSGNLIIDNLILVNGKEAGIVSRSGSILLTSGTSLTATNCRFESCSAGNGGAIMASSDSSLSFTGCTFKDNVATATTGNYPGGGAIFGSPDSMTITDCTFTGNSAPNYGGAIRVTASRVTIRGTTFSGNWLYGSDNGTGAAVAVISAPALTIEDSNFTFNNATSASGSSGGAVHVNYLTDLYVKNSNFRNNSAMVGAAFNILSSGNVKIEDSTLEGNSAFNYGLIYSSASSSFTIYNSTFTDNWARNANLAIAGETLVNVTDSTFTGNRVNSDGGVLYFNLGPTVVIAGSRFDNNSAYNGGAIYCRQSTLKVEGSNFTNGNASYEGGAIYVITSDVNVVDSIFTQNRAQRWGGAIYSNTNTVFKVVGSVFNGNYVVNESVGYGGAISTVSDSLFNISHSTFNGNDARYVGGAIFASGQNLVMSYDSFNANHARYGGAIYLVEGSQMDISNSNFTNQYTDELCGMAIEAENNANLAVSNAIFYHNTANGYDISVRASTGIIRDSIFIGTTTILGNIQQSNNQHLDSFEFSIGNIYDIVCGDSITIEISGPRWFTGTMNVTVDSNNYPVEFSNGAGSTTISGLPLGLYKAILDVHPAGTYYSAYAESNEFRVRYNTTFTIDVNPDALLGETIVINVTEANGYTGDVRLDIGSNTYTVSLTNGRGTTSVDDLNVGSYNAIIDFHEDDEYATAYCRSNQFSVMYNTTFTIDAISDAIQGETIVVGVSEANGYTGDVNLLIGRNYYVLSMTNGRGTKSISDLGVGNHKAVIDFSQSGNYASAHSESNEFRVRYNTTFTFAPIQDVVLGEPIVINVTEANGYTGQVVVLIGSKYCALSLSNGKGNTLFDDLDFGSFRAVIDFTQSGDYASTHAESNLFKVKYQPEFVISNIPDSFYGDPISFDITETHGLNATVDIVVGFFEDSVELKNGIGRVNISSIDVGVYTPLLDFKGSDTFGPAMVNANQFTVKYPSFVDLKDAISAGGSVELDYDYGFDAAYDTQFSGGINITSDVVINAKGHIIDANGLARIFDISNGAHVTIENVTIRNGKAESGGAILASADSVVTVINSTFENNTATGEGSAIYSQGTLNVNGSSFISNPACEGSGIHAESGEIVNSTIARGSVSGNVHVSDDCVLLSNPLFEIADIPDFVSGTSITIRVSESHGLTGTVEVTIGDETYLVDVENGVGVKTVTPNVPFGKYTANLKFNETKDYYSATAKSNYFQVSINPEVQIANIADTEKGKAITIKLTANRLFTGKVNVTIGGISYPVDVADGVGSISVTPNLKPGVYSAVVTYPGNENYTTVNVEGNSFRIYYSTQIVSNGVTAVYNDGKYLYVTLKDSDGNAVAGVKLKIEIAKAKTATPTTDKKGQVKILLNGISPKTYTAKITFAGNALYAKSAKSVKVIIKKATPKLTASKKTFRKSVKVKKYTITLKDNKGKAMANAKVTIKINKKSFTAKVKKNGKATFKITKFKKKGKYTATVTYKGDACYNKVSKKVKITIK